MMVLGNKYARFIKYILNTVFGNANISFGYKMLPITLYNQSEFITDSFKLAQSGYSFLIPSIALGINQKDLIDLKELENNVLKLPETLIPLSSAYTQSYRESENPVGGQEKALEEKAETTVDTYIQKGVILPKQRETALKLCLSDNDTFLELYKDAQPIIDTNTKPRAKKVDADINRLVDYFKN
jgi:hypothetical protein